MLTHQKKLNDLQINLLKSFQYIDTQDRIEEINSLINFYLEKKLDEAIDNEETKRNYTAEIYNEWLLTNTMSKTTNTLTDK
jgi:hypothetical protein